MKVLLGGSWETPRSARRLLIGWPPASFSALWPPEDLDSVRNTLRVALRAATRAATSRVTVKRVAIRAVTLRVALRAVTTAATSRATVRVAILLF